MSVYIPAATRAKDIWRSIEGKPFTVAFKTGAGATLDEQTVRVEFAALPREVESAAGQNTERRLVIIGVRDHPTQADTVIERGYRFIFGGKQYTVLDPIVLPGEVQALAEAV